MKIRTKIQRAVARFLLLSLGLNCLLVFTGAVTPVYAQRRAIVINAEQPNIWTLEQAHYLLAQMHRRNLDLKAEGLGKLDPNEINGLNLEVMRTLVEFGAVFDQAAQFNNSLLKPQKRANAERSQRLQSRRDELADESFRLNRDIARLNRESALAKTQEEKDTLAAQIAELTSLRDADDKEVERLDKDISTAGGPTGEVTATEPPERTGADKLPESSFDETFKEVTKNIINRFNAEPKLNATLRLDNFLQLQYEIIAKQLTLLRDEVGPGERIIFLEMPQTVNAAYDKANNKWAQSWWKVAGYTRLRNPVKNNLERSNQRQEGYRSTKQSGSGRESESGAADEPLTMKRVIADAVTAFGDNGSGTPDRVQYVPLDPAGKGLRIEDRSVRTIELIPRQGSLNVNDLKLRVKTGVLTAIARTLFGFGASLNVQRQRENFSQFVQQELYSSAFGKGSREFGWTFAPMPGTDRVLSGTKTTYAVMVVPEEAEALVIKSNGCYFPRSEYQPASFDETLGGRWNANDHTSRNCGGQKAFAVPIPGGGDDKNFEFWVDGLEYVPADNADRVMVSIYGRNFPAQIGMMVDGVPLTQSIGVAQPLLRDDSTAFAEASAELKDGKVLGRIERIDANQIVAVFERPNGKDGVQPVLMLTAPGKAKILNELKLYINGTKNVALNDDTTPLLFGARPADKPAFRIDKVDVFRNQNPRALTASVTGAGFTQRLTQVLVNGTPAPYFAVDSPTLLRIEFPIPADDTIKVALIAPNPNPAKPPITIQSSAVANPAKLRVENVTVVSYEPRTDDDPGMLVVRIEGTGFSDDLVAQLTQQAAAEALELAVKSPTEAILTLTNPRPAVVIVLRDTRTGQETRTVITRKGP